MNLMLSSYVPLFNSKKFHDELADGNIVLDDQALWRPLETVLLPGSCLEVVKREGALCQVTSEAYPSKNALYTHESFLEPQGLLPSHPPASLSVFFDRIHSCVEERVPYLWGGNVPHGVEMAHKIYPAKGSDPRFAQVYELRGVDCTGLIYWASGGKSVRNSSEMIYAGTSVPIAHLSSQQIIDALKPGMLIGWKGHVLIVTDRGIVESAAGEGVVLRNLEEKAASLLQERRPLDMWLEENPSQPSLVIRNLSGAGVLG